VWFLWVLRYWFGWIGCGYGCDKVGVDVGIGGIGVCGVGQGDMVILYVHQIHIQPPAPGSVVTAFTVIVMTIIAMLSCSYFVL
ncbi:hypothetical protein BZA77DRAFT_300017, partial [Pyronema omphalodes]